MTTVVRREKRRTLARIWWIAAVAAVVLGLLAYAWMDAGRMPVRTIIEPVVLPEAAK